MQSTYAFEPDTLNIVICKSNNNTITVMELLILEVNYSTLPDIHYYLLSGYVDRYQWSLTKRS